MIHPRIEKFVVVPLVLLAGFAQAEVAEVAEVAEMTAAAEAAEAPATVAADPVVETAPSTAPVADELASLRQEVLELNRELFLLEEELLYPANTQVAVFLSMDVGEFFALDAVSLRLDDKEVANYLYTERELEALLRGGVHQLYLGNLRSGEHELVAVFTGQGPSERDYRRATSLTFDKGIGAAFLELQISDREARQQPEFLVRSWD
ncbi:MAG: AraC family transcriptional regulator [Pseudomonadales bacterium]|nr:AraC family transcriptional regulator [Pseudomonadales bacterium]